MSKINLKKDGRPCGNADSGAPSAPELELINSYSQKRLGADDVFVFSVTLCDNDVDRDGERFTLESLYSLEKLFTGKTGIFDHNPSAKNQRARIFSCEVEEVPNQKTALGGAYYRLKARAYMPRQGNAELISAIESGIVKEVSVGCAVERIVCSVCGESLDSCAHIKGQTYGSRLCCGELTNPYDAYEWSFVAVPSQKRAGVTKSSYRKEMTMDSIRKSLEQGKALSLSADECEKLSDYISGLELEAQDGRQYRESLTGEVLRLSAIAQPGVSAKTMRDVASKLSIDQLREFKKAFSKAAQDFLPAPQLAPDSGKDKAERSYNEFTI